MVLASKRIIFKLAKGVSECYLKALIKETYKKLIQNIYQNADIYGSNIIMLDYGGESVLRIQYWLEY